MVTKDITVFVFENQNCVVEDYQIGGKTVSNLRLFVVDKQHSHIPSFIHVQEEITENPKYFTWNLASCE